VSRGRPRRGGPRFGLSVKSPLLGGPVEEAPARSSLGSSAGAEDGAVVEVYDPLGDEYSQPPAQPADASHLPDLRELLPATEPGRALDDWGRSERVLQLMEPTLNFYYRYWFRVQTEGIENVPSEGGALLVSNHSGALPPDAPMVMHAIRSEHQRPRPLYMLGEHWFKGYPGIGMLTNKLGLVAAHPANAQRLLRDEGRLAIVFPEGQKGTRKVLWQRYRLRRFGRGGFVRTAIRARVPIVPIAVIGAEEAMPIFAHIRPLQRISGLIYAPLNHAFPWFGLAAGAMYLPAKFRIRFLDPIDMSEVDAETAEDAGAIQAIAEDIRGRIQRELDQMLARRRSVWLG
jgi:1-acyl-sn-glycerol-3-phosphate acyltransferase